MTLDTSECEQEPIHIPGAIQPHGVLLGVSVRTQEVVLASENAESVLGRPEVRGCRLGDVIESLESVPLSSHDAADMSPLPIRLADGRPALGMAHVTEGLLLLEIEPTRAGDDQIPFPRLLRSLDQLRRAGSVSDVCGIAVDEVSALTGFDRVMVYRFDSHANGEVVAEHRRDDTLEPYLGLHYPASDIPAQARRLYVSNPVRLIVDAEYTPVPIRPSTHPVTGLPVDLSQSVLRSVSPVHCEYLRNMGVRASMSLSLLDGDRLWGLVACHHHTPRLVPYPTRLVGQFLTHVLSARIAELHRGEVFERKTAAYRVQTRLIDQMVSEARFQHGLRGGEHQLTDLLDCDGAAILYRGELTRVGNAPPDRAIRRMAIELDESVPGEIVASDHLAELAGEASAHLDRAAGAIAVPLSSGGSDRVFWFRGERARTVTWAGDPEKAVVSDGQDGPPSPRRSFAAWKAEVRGHSVPWAEWEVEVATDFRTALAVSMIHQAAELERLNASLRVESRQKSRFLATVSHDLRSPVNAILGWARIAKSAVDPTELQRALETIERNATAQIQLVDDLLDLARVEGGRLELERRRLSLTDIVRRALETVEPSVRAKSIRVETAFEPSDAFVVGDAGRLQQVVWNLLSNAIKFSPGRARVQVTVDRGPSDVTLAVADEGRGIATELLPQIFEPFLQASTTERRMGLGLGLAIVKSIVELHDGSVSVSSDGPGRGAVFTVRLPAPDQSPGPGPDDASPTLEHHDDAEPSPLDPTTGASPAPPGDGPALARGTGG